MSVSADAPRSTNAPEITTDMVNAFLAGREGRAVDRLTVLRQGGWSSAWAYEVGERHEVIRFSHIADDFERDRLASIWSSPLVPVPTFIELGDAFGAKYAITEWANGVGLDSLDADGLRAILPSLFSTLDAMRSIKLPGTRYGGWDTDGNGSHESWAEFLRSVGEDDADGRLPYWREQLAASPLGVERFDAAMAVLDGLADRMPSLRHVVHNDLINANVLVDGDRITAVLDWGCGLTGDFLFDLAWFAFYRPWYPQWADVDVIAAYRVHAASIGLDLPDFDLRLCCYQICLGLGDVRYNAFMRNWANAEWTINRVDEVAGAIAGQAER
jgi:hygromycin-B 4-O-kinase